MFFILALVLALVRYLVMVLDDLLAQNDHLEQIVVGIETIDLSIALASLLMPVYNYQLSCTDSLITIFAVFRDKFPAFIKFFLERLTKTMTR
jgi:hypothetical protein